MYHVKQLKTIKMKKEDKILFELETLVNGLEYGMILNMYNIYIDAKVSLERSRKYFIENPDANTYAMIIDIDEQLETVDVNLPIIKEAVIIKEAEPFEHVKEFENIKLHIFCLN